MAQDDGAAASAFAALGLFSFICVLDSRIFTAVNNKKSVRCPHKSERQSTLVTAESETPTRTHVPERTTTIRLVCVSRHARHASACAYDSCRRAPFARTSTLWGARGQPVLGTSMRPIGAHVAQPPGGSPLHACPSIKRAAGCDASVLTWAASESRSSSAQPYKWRADAPTRAGPRAVDCVLVSTHPAHALHSHAHRPPSLQSSACPGETASPPGLSCTGVLCCCSASTQRTKCVQTAPSHPRPCRPGHLRERGS